MRVDDIVAIPECAAIPRDDLYARVFSCATNSIIALARVGVRVLFKNKVRHAPCFEEFREESLRALAEDEEFRLGVEFCDGL
jgi:hypothetical protein